MCGRLASLAVISLVVLLCVACQTGQEQSATASDVKKLNQQVVTLYRAGRYRDAERPAKKLLAIREKALGPDHPHTASSLDNLAFLYWNQDKYGKAEPLYQRSLAIREKALGPDHPDTASSLNNLAFLYWNQDKYGKAEPLYQRSLAIREKALGPDHPDTASSLNNLAFLYQAQSKYGKAEPLYQRSLAIREKALGPDHPSTAISLNNLASLYSNQGKYGKAEPLYQRSLAIREKALGPDHPSTATSLNSLAELYHAQGKYGQAEPLYQRSLAIREKALGPDHPNTVVSLNNLALLYSNQGKYGQAEPLLQRSLAIIEKALGPDHPATAGSLNNLALLYSNQGKYGQAEPLYQRSLAIREKSLGPDHPATAGSLNNLALLYKSQRKYGKAEPLYQRSLAIREKALGPDHPNTATSLNELALLYKSQGKYGQAEPLYQRSLAIREKALGPDHPHTATSLGNLASLYDDQGKYGKAESLYRRSLAIREKSLGPDHPSTAASLNNLAGLYKSQGKYGQAEPLYQRSLAIAEKALGPDHPLTALSLWSLAVLYHNQGRADDALDMIQRATTIYAGRTGSGRGATSEQKTFQSAYLFHLSLLAKRAGRLATATSGAIAQSATALLQLAQASDVAATLQQMAARFAAGDGALARLVRRHQDNLARLKQVEAKVEGNLTKTAEECDPACRDEARQILAGQQAELAKTAEILREDFPKYAELTHPQPLTLQRIQGLLRPKEILLAHVFGKISGYVLAVSQSRAELHGIKATSSQMRDMVAKLRQDVDPTAWNDITAFDAPLASRLYDLLIRPVESMLVQDGHVILVPDAVTISLPPQLLLSEPQPSPVQRDAHATFAKLPWLVRRVSFSILPAISSFAALRDDAQESDAKRPFLGVGDPLYHNNATSRGKQEPATGGDAPPVTPRRRFAGLALLPESADELKQIAAYLGLDDSTLLLGQDAGEKRIREISLHDYRIIAFATHGLLVKETEELFGLSEPALVFTPARVAEDEDAVEEDDGLLTASEIAKLKLDANWVILSACNTASSGEEGTQGLSGLAKAFFYAGARTLFVTHWSVFSEAAKQMTVSTLRNAQKKAVSRAGAHRLAMLEMLGKGGEFSHPVAWAPFAVIGDGGATAK